MSSEGAAVERIRFTVTQDDIKAGRAGTASACPVALALVRTTGAVWFVTEDDADAYDDPTGPVRRYQLSRRVSRFVRAFDDDRNPAPFTGEIFARPIQSQDTYSEEETA